MPMPGRNVEGGYRYGYQGEFAEKEPELPGRNSFQLRLYDSRIGRWTSPDPYGEFHSPYLANGNNPISNVDPSGGCINKSGRECEYSVLTGQATDAAGHVWTKGSDGVPFSETAHAAYGASVFTDGYWTQLLSKPLPSNHISNGIDSHLTITGSEKIGGMTMIKVQVALPTDFGGWNSPGSDGRVWIGCMSCHGNNGAYRTLAKNNLFTGIGYAGAAALDFSSGALMKPATAVRGLSYFDDAVYSEKVLLQMSRTKDKLHAFPRSVDGYANKYGKWSTKVGGDGKVYEWLELPGGYGSNTGTFEYIKDANGVINHRFLNTMR